MVDGAPAGHRCSASHARYTFGEQTAKAAACNMKAFFSSPVGPGHANPSPLPPQTALPHNTGLIRIPPVGLSGLNAASGALWNLVPHPGTNRGPVPSHAAA